MVFLFELPNFQILNEENCVYLISYTLNQDLFFLIFNTLKRGLDTKSGYCRHEILLAFRADERNGGRGVH